jgi:hypothetical protein
VLRKIAGLTLGWNSVVWRIIVAWPIQNALSGNETMSSIPTPENAWQRISELAASQPRWWIVVSVVIATALGIVESRVGHWSTESIVPVTLAELLALTAARAKPKHRKSP